MPSVNPFQTNLILLLALCLGLPAYALPANMPHHFNVQHLEPALLKLDQEIRTYLKTKHIPGCAVAVVHQNKIVFMRAYGQRSLDQPEPIDVDTVFQLGSVSKPLASSLLSILEHKGYLHLDDPVHHYLKNFSPKNRHAKQALKIKHILSHSSGVPRAGFNQLIESHTPYLHIRNRLQNSLISHAIGKRYDYNNAMYGTLSEVTYMATKHSFKDALQLNLLAPLKMSRTTTTLNGLLQTENRAQPHVRDHRGVLSSCASYSQGYYAVAPAGGINSSLRDMSIFLQAQMGGYPEVLNAKMLNRIHTPQVQTDPALGSVTRYPQLINQGRYAMGWRVVHFGHHKLIFHGGWVKGFTNFIGFMPEHKIGIVVLHNSESKFSSKVGVHFFESLLELPIRPPSRSRLARTKSIHSRTKTNRIKIIRPLKRLKTVHQVPAQLRAQARTQAHTLKKRPTQKKYENTVRK